LRPAPCNAEALGPSAWLHGSDPKGQPYCTDPCESQASPATVAGRLPAGNPKIPSDGAGRNTRSENGLTLLLWALHAGDCPTSVFWRADAATGFQWAANPVPLGIVKP